MANKPFLLQSNFNSSPLLQQTFNFPRIHSFPIKFSYTHNNSPRINHPSHKLIKSSPKLTIKCVIMNHNPNRCQQDNELKPVATRNDVNQVIWRSITNILKTLQKPLITGVLLGFLLLSDHHHGCVAMAASGGRMGGRSFSSSSASRSYTTRTRGPELSFSAPYYAPTPFGGGGFFVGPAVGVGSSFFFVMMGFAAFILVSGFLSDRSDADDGSVLTATEKTSVLKLQVACGKDGYVSVGVKCVCGKDGRKANVAC